MFSNTFEIVSAAADKGNVIVIAAEGTVIFASAFASAA